EIIKFSDRREGIGVCGWILVSVSFLLVLITFPISIWACIKVVREYERAVVFRLGRILSKKAKGPGECMQFYSIRMHVIPRKIAELRETLLQSIQGMRRFSASGPLPAELLLF
uniref:Uncharacterized protein n=1 Tax=Pavo cristatus TaxID=9049 RepID=A0A8C9G0N9_PAVCR